jgi:sRNA-binding protein
MKKEAKRWHLLSPEDYNKVFDYLSKKYPKLFIKDVVFIFKKGVHQDIFNDTELECSKTVIRKFIKLYTEQKKYIELHIEGAPRYDLEGKEVDFVTKEDIESLAKKQDEIKKQIVLKKIKKPEKNKYNGANKGVKAKSDNGKVEPENTNNNKQKLELNIKVGNKNG